MQLPQRYGDLIRENVIDLTQKEGFAQGYIKITNVIPGRYKIHYLRPKTRQHNLKSANVELVTIGEGFEISIKHP